MPPPPDDNVSVDNNGDITVDISGNDAKRNYHVTIDHHLQYHLNKLAPDQSWGDIQERETVNVNGKELSGHEIQDLADIMGAARAARLISGVGVTERDVQWFEKYEDRLVTIKDDGETLYKSEYDFDDNARSGLSEAEKAAKKAEKEYQKAVEQEKYASQKTVLTAPAVPAAPALDEAELLRKTRETMVQHFPGKIRKFDETVEAYRLEAGGDMARGLDQLYTDMKGEINRVKDPETDRRYDVQWAKNEGRSDEEKAMARATRSKEDRQEYSRNNDPAGRNNNPAPSQPSSPPAAPPGAAPPPPSMQRYANPNHLKADTSKDAITFNIQELAIAAISAIASSFEGGFQDVADIQLNSAGTSNPNLSQGRNA